MIPPLNKEYKYLRCRESLQGGEAPLEPPSWEGIIIKVFAEYLYRGGEGARF